MKHSDLVYLTVNDSPTNDRTTSTVSSPRPVGAEEMEGVEEMKHNDLANRRCAQRTEREAMNTEIKANETEGMGAASELSAGLERLAELAKRNHTYCEDGWYSCPKAEDGCYNEGRGTECDCGADEHNAEVDALMVLLRSNAEITGG